MRKLTTTIIIITIGLLCLCACTSKDSPSTTVPATQTTANSVVVVETTQTTLTSDTQTTLDEPASTDSITASQQNNLTVSFTKTEIVSMFNAAANKVKLEEPGYVLTEKSNADEKNIILSDNVPKQIPISKFIASAINKLSKDPLTIKKGENHNDFPVKGQNWASKLEPSALKSATCVDKGDYYEIELTFKDEKLTALPDTPEQTAHGKAFSVLLEKEFRAAFGGFNALGVRVDVQKFVPEYKGSTIRCKVDKAGHMITATYYLNTVSMVQTGIKVMGKSHIIDIQLEYSLTDEYIFN